MASNYGNGDILTELRKMVENDELGERPAIRLLLSSQIKIIGGIQTLDSKLDGHKHAGTDVAIDMLRTQLTAGDKLARAVSIIAGIIGLAVLALGMLHVF